MGAVLTILNKFKQRRFVQKLIIELIADSLMLIAWLVIGYLFKTTMF